MDTVRWAMFTGELNRLMCCAGDIGSAYLHGITNERISIVAGPEFGELEGKTFIVYKLFYGLRTSAARWREHLTKQLRELGFKPSKADSDLWIREMDDHYKMITTLVDDILCWSRNPIKEKNGGWHPQGTLYVKGSLESLNTNLKGTLNQWMNIGTRKGSAWAFQAEPMYQTSSLSSKHYSKLIQNEQRIPWLKTTTQSGWVTRIEPQWNIKVQVHPWQPQLDYNLR